MCGNINVLKICCDSQLTKAYESMCVHVHCMWAMCNTSSMIVHSSSRLKTVSLYVITMFIPRDLLAVECMLYNISCDILSLSNNLNVLGGRCHGTCGPTYLSLFSACIGLVGG